MQFPGDKSISHRALMFTALAVGESRISNLSTGADVQSTRKCLDACGIEIWVEGNDVKYYIDKAGGYSWNARTAKLRLIKANTGTWIKPRKKSKGFYTPRTLYTLGV